MYKILEKCERNGKNTSLNKEHAKNLSLKKTIIKFALPNPNHNIVDR